MILRCVSTGLCPEHSTSARASQYLTCSTQMTPFQRVQILGTTGRIEIEIPFNAPPDKPTRIFVDEGAGIRTEEFGICDQYTLQGDMFSRAVRGQGEVPTPLEDSLANMVVIEAMFASERSESWVEISTRIG